MSSNGQAPPSADSFLEEILEPIAKQRRVLEAERQHHQLAIEMLNEEIRKLDRVLRAADPTRTPGKPGPKPKGEGRTRPRVAEAKVVAAIREIRKRVTDSDASFTSNEIRNWVKVSSSASKALMLELRERELIRFVGHAPAPPGGRGSGANLYKLMPTDAD